NARFSHNCTHAHNKDPPRRGRPFAMRHTLNEAGWPIDADARLRLGLLMDRVDRRWLARDINGLRAVVQEFHATLAAAPATQAGADSDAAVIGPELSLPPGSVGPVGAAQVQSLVPLPWW